MSINDTELSALMRLLDDDRSNIEALVEQIARWDETRVERLQSTARDHSSRVQRNVQDAITRRQFLRIEDRWRSACERPDMDIEAGLEQIARANGFADDTRARLDELSELVSAQLSGDRAMDMGMTAIADVLRAKDFKGNKDDYYNPRNSILSCVLETGLGIPLSLTCVAMLVGRRLDLPVHGIGTPGHFMGFYGDPALHIGWYFDSFDGFKKVSVGQIMNIVGLNATGVIDAAAFQKVNDREILSRTLRNLIGAYARVEAHERVRNLKRWLDFAQPSPA